MTNCHFCGSDQNTGVDTEEQGGFPGMFLIGRPEDMILNLLIFIIYFADVEDNDDWYYYE